MSELEQPPGVEAGAATGQATAPRMRRRRSARVVAGVCGGLADHLGVRALWVRLAFVVLAPLSGAGVLAYGLLWVFVPQASPAEDTSGSRRERQQAIGLLVLGAGLTIAGTALSGLLNGWVAVPLAVTLAGAAVVWREADESQRRRWRSGSRSRFASAFLGGGGVSAVIRICAGVALVGAGILLVVLHNGTLSQIQFALLAVSATLVGVAVLTVPFWLRMMRDLTEERKARIRTDERAAIAAHLHDSVLQTLALIQKQSESPREVARLARGQERELRGWLYGTSARGGAATDGGATESAAEQPGASGSGTGEGLLSAALAAACGDVEDRFAVSVQHVVVGEAELDEALTAQIQAAREAVVNAAKHSGVTEVSVYAEVEQSQVTVFVRDRGSGFDPEQVASDRHGLADSIRGRMERNGGSCGLRTAPGQGTEVRLELPLPARAKEGVA